MQVCKYASMQVCKYAIMQVCKYASMLVYKYASLQVCMYMQVCKYASMAPNVMLCFTLKQGDIIISDKIPKTHCTEMSIFSSTTLARNKVNYLNVAAKLIVC